ncbi:MAG: phosphatidylserine decarboxylase family protein [Bacteroidales bacterium]|nr:phosphatidylserine decarboxylase family protein [Lentimicrobiaceae bacterium]MDD5695760.1 phosphatidylserine decarboxylase family protein [Bacteroidales bacterium]
MRIHKEGKGIIVKLSLGVGLIFLLLNIFFPHQTIIHGLLYLAGVVFIAMVFYFFRQPAGRVGNPDPSLILSAADGKVVIISKVFEDEYFKDQRMQVSVFMSLVDMHVNLFPVTGTVRYAQYHPGKFLFAYHPKASSLNEHNSVVIETPSGFQILIRQIAGGLARRIVSLAKSGTEVVSGQEIGIIKFGSRVDIFLPLDSRIQVQVGQHVRCGKTILASLPEPQRMEHSSENENTSNVTAS